MQISLPRCWVGLLIFGLAALGLGLLGVRTTNAETSASNLAVDDPNIKPEIRNCPARETPGLLARMLEGPLKNNPIVICTLKNNIGGAGLEGDYGWTLHGQVGYLPEAKGLSMAERQSLLRPTPKFGVGPSKILRVDLHTRQFETIFQDPDGGVVRDAVVSYDGKRILFSMRKANEIAYHLNEMNADGTNLRQLTDGLDNEVEPCYLPDGGIVYVSSKAHRFTPCNAHEVGNLWRCDADGKHQCRLTNGMDAERTPWVMGDGRISFGRWDYVHRDQGTYFGLWSINPDGTDHKIVYGNYNFFDFGFPGYAKSIPGSTSLVSAICYVHGLEGVIATIDPTRGPDDVTACRITSLGNPPSTLEMLNSTASMAEWIIKSTGTRTAYTYWREIGPTGRSLQHMDSWTDPYPISTDCFLVTNTLKNELCVMDGQGNFEVVCAIPGSHIANRKIVIEGVEVPLTSSSVLSSAQPLAARPREPIVPTRTDWTKHTGTMILSNIYEGRQFANVKKGSISSLMIMENLPEPLRFSDDEGISLGEYYNVTRYWGSVPVESDGSANFEVPAVRSLSLIAVDDQGREVKYMRTQVNVMPGEVIGCIGCHERRTQAPASQLYAGNLLAMRRLVSKPKIPTGVRHTPVSYTKDIQPLLDKYCVTCHNSETPDGKIILEGHHTPSWSVSYAHLFTARQIITAGNPRIADDPVIPTLAAISPLLQKFSGGHHGVKATNTEVLTVRLWIDEDAKYGPYTMSGYSGRIHPLDPVPPYNTDVLVRRCDTCHVGDVADAKNTANGRLVGLNSWPMADRLVGGSTARGDATINLDYPEKSLLLRAPLAKEAGGLGWCQQTAAVSKAAWQYKPGTPAMVFASKDDPDYQKLLASIRAGSDYFNKNIRRFDMPGYRPNHWLEVMLRNWGVIPKEYDLAKEGWDAEKIDDLYFDHAIYPNTKDEVHALTR